MSSRRWQGIVAYEMSLRERERERERDCWATVVEVSLREG